MNVVNSSYHNERGRAKDIKFVLQLKKCRYNHFFYLQKQSEQLHPDQFPTHLIITSNCKASAYKINNNICLQAVEE